MHGLSYINIKNFRACRDVSLPLDSFTPLVGQNNTGKSSIIEAINWVVKPSAISAVDFANPEQPVIVTACIDGITAGLLDRIPDARHKAAIEPFCNHGRLWIRAVASAPGKKPDSEIWDVAAYKGGIPQHWRVYPTGLPQAVSILIPEALYIEAMDDIGEDLGKAKAGTTIKSLLDEIMVPIMAAHAELNTAIETIRHILTTNGDNRSGHLKVFDTEATNALSQFFPGLEIDLDFQVLEIKDFFKAGDLHVTDGVTGDRRRFDQMGTGAQRAIQMSLIRYLAETRSKDPEKVSRRLLLIDEPELYLHPQGIRRLRQALQILADSGFQVVFSTHSPMMLSRDNATDTVIVSKSKDHGTTTKKPLRQAVLEALSDAESQSRTLFELGNLAEIYFSDLVVLCEGKTDRRLLPLAYEQIYGLSPELEQIVFVSLGSCADIPKALPVLKSMGIKACAVADLDFGFVDARKGAMLPKDGLDLVKAKDILKRLEQEQGILLADNGLPKNGNGNSAADTWTIFAQDAEGRSIASKIHNDLKEKQVWVWSGGSIEQVTQHGRKGEEAIIEQEQKIRVMSLEDFKASMPDFIACFDWIRNL